MAVIQGLMAIKAVPSIVTITSDSKYVLEAGERGAYSRHAANPDLLAEMHRLARMHTTSWFWTEGHAGHDDNEQCDLLAHKAALTQTSSWPNRSRANLIASSTSSIRCRNNPQGLGADRWPAFIESRNLDVSRGTGERGPGAGSQGPEAGGWGRGKVALAGGCFAARALPLKIKCL